MLTKDDMLASAGVSLKIEEQRREDFYYLTSRSLMMGTPLPKASIYTSTNRTRTGAMH
jgi:hypothetical protein